ncbi:MAG: ABC transporter permease [Candidatus Ancillula sp.]|jgi:putative ABC transport system permease protein|nr:ABC transporter permease [Candidatus Ancillula sp.]
MEKLLGKKSIFKDLLLEAVNAVAASKVRTILTMLGTILGVSSFIAIVGLGATANGQISKGFNELQATHITVTDNETKSGNNPGFNFPDDATSRLKALNGIKNAGAYFLVDLSSGSQNNSVSIDKRPEIDKPANSGRSLSIYAANEGTLQSAGAKIKSGVMLNEYFQRENQNVVILGCVAAKVLGISSVATHPTVFIKNTAYSVIGILDEVSSIMSELNSSVIMPINTALKNYGPPAPVHAAQMLIETDLGAAKLASIQAPFALSHEKPKMFVSSAPPDWSHATEGAENSLNSFLVVLSLMAVVIGGVAITNTTLVSVIERTGEIGLRLALGARKIHIAIQFILESAILGGIGSVIGNALGILVVLIGSILHGWTPILNPIFLLIAPFAGVVIGIISGIYPAYRTTKVNPAVALSGGV